MKYKILESGNSSKHNNQNNYQWNIKHQKQGTDQNITNNQNNYQWNIKHQKQGTVENITIKTTTNGI